MDGYAEIFEQKKKETEEMMRTREGEIIARYTQKDGDSDDENLPPEREMEEGTFRLKWF